MITLPLFPIAVVWLREDGGGGHVCRLRERANRKHARVEIIRNSSRAQVSKSSCRVRAPEQICERERFGTIVIVSFGKSDEVRQRIIRAHLSHHLATTHLDRDLAHIKLRGDLLVQEAANDKM